MQRIQTIMALTISFWLFFKARTALARDTLACDITSSMSFASVPLSSTYNKYGDISPLGSAARHCSDYEKLCLRKKMHRVCIFLKKKNTNKEEITLCTNFPTHAVHLKS